MAPDSLLDHVLDPDDVLILVDGGARSGPLDVVPIHPHACVYCFEPSPSEASKIGPITSRIAEAPPVRGRVIVYPIALGSTTGETTLNVSLRPGATSTLEPNAEILEHFRADHWSEMAEIVERFAVPCVSLSDFMGSSHLRYIDFLKLDTQGNELEILAGAKSFLDQISVIRTEVEFLPIYKGQALFHDVAKFLLDKGFELVDIAWSHPCRRFHALDRLPPEAYRLVWADAVFVNRPYDTSRQRGLQQAVVLGALGYADLAVYLLRRQTNLSEAKRAAAERFVLAQLRPKTWRGRVRRVLEKLLGASITRYDWRQGKQVPSLRPGRR